jgi:hypothetical protein
MHIEVQNRQLSLNVVDAHSFGRCTLRERNRKRETEEQRGREDSEREGERGTHHGA